MSFNATAVDGLMQAGVARGVFPGGVLAVARGQDLIFERAYGHADLFSNRPMQIDTFFDLASLTKPLATVLAVMVLVRKGVLALDQPCGDLCPPIIDMPVARASIRHLLQHRSGLKPWHPFFMHLRHLEFEDRRAAMPILLGQTALAADPGKRSDYSDLGYMVLQWAIETAANSGLAEFVVEQVYAPLGIDDFRFNDTRLPVSQPEIYAATQFCPWRHKLLLGHVDDDNAYINGGIGGHAGLFGTASAVIRLLQAMLAAENNEARQTVFDTKIVRRFFESRADERWALGFDTPSKKDSSAGRHFPPDSIGHLGFTGTSFWVHRQKRIVVVLLTNRVHPFRFNAGIKAFRPKLHDAVMENIA